MKKIIALAVLLAALTSLFGCKSKMYKDITYKEGGISFTLPNTMRRVEMDDYDFYFTDRATVFTATELKDEFYKENSYPKDMTAKQYVDICMEKNEMDPENMEYIYDEEKNIHSFRYAYDNREDVSVFYYVVVTGDPGNIWYIEMCCSYSESYYYTSTFGAWKNTILAYNEN